jgi:hypothetical protein
MSQPNGRRARALLGVSGLAAVAGCGLMSPYDHDTLLAKAPASSPDGWRLAGGAESALQLADQLRLKYIDNLRTTAIVRNSTAVAAGTLTGWALYNALKPAGSGRTDGDTRRDARLGATLGTLYGLRQFFVNSDQESAYAEGARALTCLMIDASPLLMTELNSPRQADNSASNAAARSTSFAQIFLPPLQSNAGDLDRLRPALDLLESRILHMNLLVAQLEAGASEMAADDDAIKKSQDPLRDQIKKAKFALSIARNAWSEGRTLLSEVESAGYTISKSVGVIQDAVNIEVQAKQNNLAGATDLLKNAHDIMSGILNIGGTTAADQAEVVGADTPQSAAPTDSETAAVMAIWRGDWTRRDSASPSFFMTAASAGRSRPVATASPSSALAASAAASQASSAGTTVKHPTRTPATPKPPTATATSAELQTIRDQIDTALKGIQGREQKAKQEAEAKVQRDAIEAKNKTIRRLGERLEARELECGRLSSQFCAAKLAQETEYLYAARRPVAQELLNFRHRVRAVSTVPECAALASLRVTPNEAMSTRPGGTVSFVISQRAAGNPIAVLEGPVDDTTGVKFEYTPLAGSTLYSAKLTIGAKMPPQRVRLVVTDSKGVTTQTVPIVVLRSLPPVSAASQPASAASVPAKGSALPGTST